MHLCAKIYVRRSSEHRIGGENAPWAERSRMGHLYRTAWQTNAAPRAKAQITSPVKLRPEPKVQCPEERPDDDLLVLVELCRLGTRISSHCAFTEGEAFFKVSKRLMRAGKHVNF